MKVVLDTNVLIDGFRDAYSYEKRIIDEIIAGRLEAYANKQTIQENHLILKKLISSPEYEQELARFFDVVTQVINRRQIRVVSDPEDNKILESAVEAKADYLITRDQALLELDKFQGINIIDPVGFWARYKDEGEDLWRQWTNYITNSTLP